MTFFQISQVFIYEVIDLIPNLFLIIVAFGKHLRVSKNVTFLLLSILYIMISSLRVLGLTSQSYAAFLSVFSIILYLIFFTVCFRTDFAKFLFVLLTILNYGSLLSIVLSCCRYYIFPVTANFPYSIYSTAALAFFYIISYPVMFWMFREKLRSALDFASNNRYWRFLWLVPATFCLSYYYNLYSNGGIIAFSQELNNVLFAVFFILGALFVTYLVLKLIEESNQNLTLKNENDQLSLQSLQYEYLKNRIEDARRAKHDLRQSMTVIQSYVKDDDKEGLLHYISQYIRSLPSDSPIHYCSNYALNALIVYYETIAKEHHIRFQAEIDYPENTGLKDTDIIVLFGNMLENALEACLRVPNGKTCVMFQIKPIHDVLVTTLDNTYFGKIYRSDEKFQSSKSSHTGLGTASIQNITKKYNGVVQFEYDEQTFHVSVMLNPNNHGQNIL